MQLRKQSAEHPELTEKELLVLFFVQDYHDTHDQLPPSFQDIATARGIKSTNTVAYFVSRLEAKGYIKRTRGVHKPTIRVLKRVKDCEYCFKPVVGAEAHQECLDNAAERQDEARARAMVNGG